MHVISRACSACRGQERASDALKLAFRKVENCLWALGNESRFSASDLNYLAISPAHVAPHFSLILWEFLVKSLADRTGESQIPVLSLHYSLLQLRHRC